MLLECRLSLLHHGLDPVDLVSECLIVEVDLFRVVLRAAHQLLHVLFTLPLEVRLLHLLDLLLEVHLFDHLVPLL